MEIWKNFQQRVCLINKEGLNRQEFLYQWIIIRDKKRQKNHSTPIDHYLYLRMQNLYENNIKLGLMRHPFLPQLINMLEESVARDIFNVHHMKWYIFDNKVIFTGANLQEQYFINRQDRYMVFHEANEIADYLDDAQSALLQHAYYVDFDSNSKFDPLRTQPFKRQEYFQRILSNMETLQIQLQRSS